MNLLACGLILVTVTFFSCQNKQSIAKPEENRFVKTVLTQGEFFEPTEMTILPDLSVLIVQRRGEILKFDNTSKKVKQVGFLNVYYRSAKANTEEGLLGVTADPDFSDNHFVYIYYSPVGKDVDRLSRFEFKNDTIDNKTEKVILEVKTDRDICCHTAGSLTFGNDDQLFLSTGDNSTPFDEMNGEKYPTHAFGPMDDRPGHFPYDARRSAANTNDLRGKILRIKINSDGTYSIPDGNLFPQGEAKTRPEIYIMGDRNPYRISFDKRSGYLYWGEVGPDALADSLKTRGPMGYDEVNQARQAGNFGWPLFVGNNYAYHRHNYATNADGPAYDPAKPVNESRNNTGLMYLPPAQAAFIWYPYGVSKEFPELGSGGRTAMAGPVYNYSSYPDSSRYPKYYDGKLFIYDFIRGWIKAVTMKPNGDYDHMEGFMEHTKFNGMIDMEMGPDGRIYVLEYGNGWFTRNPEAALSRLDYLPGNRPPAVSDLSVNKKTGNLPFVLKAKVKAVDPENDDMTYVWSMGSNKKETKTPSLEYTINQAGDYDISVQVFDSHRAWTKSDVISIYAGNEQPKIDITLQGNQQFYFPGNPVQYKVNVTDNGDKVNWNNLVVSTKYEFSLFAQPTLGDQLVPETVLGKNLMLSLDCKSCHKIDSPSIGPAFKNVAKRYFKNPDATLFLPLKIIKGGSGHWGEVAMSAHPALKEEDARSIVNWILTLADTTKKAKSLPAMGSIIPKPDPKQPDNTLFDLNATYTDNGGPGIRALSAAKSVSLRSSKMDVVELSNVYGFAGKDSLKQHYLVFPADTGSFGIGKVNLTGISAIEFTGYSRDASTTCKFDVAIYNDKARNVGVATMTFSGKQKVTLQIPLKLIDEKARDFYVLFKQMTKVKGANNMPLLKTLRFVPAK